MTTERTTLKIALAQLNPIVGDITGNLTKARDGRRKAAAVASAAERAAADAKKNRRAAAARRMDDVERRASALLRSIEDRERAKRGFPNRTSSVGLAVGIASNAAKKRAAAKSKGKKK